jgi:hypothetical protein
MMAVSGKEKVKLLLNPSARGAYMLLKSVVLVFIRFRVIARYHEKLI